MFHPQHKNMRTKYNNTTKSMPTSPTPAAPHNGPPSVGRIWHTQPAGNQHPWPTIFLPSSYHLHTRFLPSSARADHGANGERTGDENPGKEVRKC